MVPFPTKGRALLRIQVIRCCLLYPVFTCFFVACGTTPSRNCCTLGTCSAQVWRPNWWWSSSDCKVITLNFESHSSSPDTPVIAPVAARLWYVLNNFDCWKWHVFRVHIISEAKYINERESGFSQKFASDRP